MSAKKAHGNRTDRTNDAGEYHCKRCGCTEGRACVDKRTMEPCSWTHIDQVCSACLTDAEFEEFLESMGVFPVDKISATAARYWRFRRRIERNLLPHGGEALKP